MMRGGRAFKAFFYHNPARSFAPPMSFENKDNLN